MKIALVMGAYSYGGAERVMCSLANYFSERYEVVLITLFEAERVYHISDRVACVNGINGKNDLDIMKGLRGIFKTEKPDVIISFITHINIASILASRGLRIPVIISERNDPKQSATSSFRKLLRKLTYPLASGIVFQTEDAKNYFSAYIRKKSTIIPNPLFLHVEAMPVTERKHEIVVAARYVPQKRHDLIIQAFSNVAGKSDYILSCYGSGDEKIKLQKMVEEFGLTNRIFLHDAVTDLHERIKSAKVFIMMSEYEGMPNALMEAMGLGLACISSDCPCGGPRFLIENGKNGVLVESGNLEQLTQVLNNMLSDEAFMQKIAAEAINIRDTLSSDKIFQRWDCFIHNVMRSCKEV